MFNIKKKRNTKHVQNQGRIFSGLFPDVRANAHVNMKVNERASRASVMSSTRSLARPSCRQHVRSHVRSHVHHVVNTFAGTSVPHSYPALSNLSKTIINETLKKAKLYSFDKQMTPRYLPAKSG